MSALPAPRFRRMRDVRFEGSACPSIAMTYSILVWGRRNMRIVGDLRSSSLRETFLIVRALMRRYPARMVSVSRTIYGDRRAADPSRAAFAVPDYSAFRVLTPYGPRVPVRAVGRGGFATGSRPRMVATNVRRPSDVLAALLETGRLRPNLLLAGAGDPAMELAA